MKRSAISVEEVRIRLHPDSDGGVIGWASCVLNDSIYLNNIAIVRGDQGRLRLAYPTVRSQSDARHFHFNPITRDAQRAFDVAILGRLTAEKGP